MFHEGRTFSYRIFSLFGQAGISLLVLCRRGFPYLQFAIEVNEIERLHLKCSYFPSLLTIRG